MYDKIIELSGKEIKFLPLTLRDILFNPLSHRSENSNVIYSHIGDQFITLSLATLRSITCAISEKLISFGLKTGDTIMLTSFSSSNELSNALIFAGAVCTGIRVFVPIFPEPLEFEKWEKQTGFKCIIMPYDEILKAKGYEREKEAVHLLKAKCGEYRIPFFDSNRDFDISSLIRQAKELPGLKVSIPVAGISHKTEAVIFTTSGTSGNSKLVVYTHEGLANCSQSWHQCGLFANELFGNPGFSPLFTHTIGIRTFINSIWSGNPFCIVVTDWFLHKPEVARYLLMKMTPGHIIAGPAFFNTLLELFRQYPELKSGMHTSLKSAISIGAPFDELTALKFKSATGVSMMNGFGTTETLMISLNRPENEKQYSPRSMGMLLPGVKLRLVRTGEASVYNLFIHSDFQSDRTIGENIQHDYFETGDLVTYDDNSHELIYQRRKSIDFIKDEFGVKIPLPALQKYYDRLYKVSLLIEWIPLVNIPGLAAMIFIRPTQHAYEQKEIAALIKNINEELKHEIEPFEYAHRHIERFSLVYDEVPLTRKGTASKDQIFKKYEQLIAELRNPYVFSQKIETTETGNKNAIFKFSNPGMAELLEALKMDKAYIKGEGDYLYYQDGEKLQPVIDLVGGFGSNLLGHNHPRIREAIIRFLEAGYPAINNQGSLYYYPGLLAKELNRIYSKSTGRYFKVQFGNSGTEATEIALHHAYFEWRQKIEKLRDEQLQLYGDTPGNKVAEVWDTNMLLLEQTTPAVMVVNNCFHGYSSGARSMLNPRKQRKLFSGLLKLKPLHVSDTEKNWAEQVSKYISDNAIDLPVFVMQDGIVKNQPTKFSTIIASIIEPIRGEGGIYEINPALADLLASQDFPLISDEIQCGLGRSGSIPSYKHASYYLLGKSLGGGIEKISAVLIDDNRFRPAFTKYYNSTFANGELAANAALTALQIIDADNLAALAAEKGSKFITILKDTASLFPDIIETISGKGLMIGIHFSSKLGNGDNILRVLIENELSGYLFAGWMLNRYNIRVLPSLSKPNSIRIEPSFYFSDSCMKAFNEALGEFCILCREKRSYELFKFLMNEDVYSDKIHPEFKGEFPRNIESPAVDSIKVGFIGNFTLPHRELQLIEPDFKQASDTGLRMLFNRLQVLLEGKPVKIFSKNLMNSRVHFTFYVLPFDTSQMEVVSRWGKKRFYIARIQEAVDKLSSEGVACISLGAHTSIITGNGLNLAERENCRILTGNSLTVASCLHYLNRYLEDTESNISSHLTIAIVGANGNIGTGLVECLVDPKYTDYEIILAGNSEKRLHKLKEMLSTRNAPVLCTSDLFELRRADIIICCANTNDPIVFPHHIREENQVYIIDLSVPCSVSDKVKKMQNVRFCKDASSVFLGDDQTLLISTHTPQGKIFCCAAESILCALYDLKEPMKGHIHRDAVKKLLHLGIHEGLLKSTLS